MSRILSVGLNLMDIYVDQDLMYPGGNELNVAVYASRLGAESAFMGVFGTDETVPLIREVLKKEKVDFSHSRVVEGENGNSFVRLVDGDRVFFAHNNGGVTGKYPIRIREEDIPYIRSFDVITSSVYGRVPLAQMKKLCALGVPVAFDFSFHRQQTLLDSLLPLMTIAFFSCADLSQEETCAILCRANQSGCRYCIGTRGGNGAILFDGESFRTQPAVTVKTVDTMGAGDSFLAAFLLKFFDERKAGRTACEALESAFPAAARFAAEICTKSGAIGYAFPIPEGYCSNR